MSTRRTITSARGAVLCAVRWAALPALVLGLALATAPSAMGHGVPEVQFTTLFQSLSGSGWLGGDGANSVVLPDGRTAWLFSDTVTACSATTVHLVHNSIVVTGGRRTQVIVNPLPPGSDGAFYWPAAVRVRGAEAWVLAQRIIRTGSGVWNFRTTGTWLARLDLRSWRLLSLRPLVRCCINWSSAMFDSGGYTYVYGVEGDGLGSWLHVARVPRGRLDLPWRFYTGTAWAADPVRSARVLAGVSSVSILDLGRRGLRLVSHAPVFGTAVYAWQARSPVGPFRMRRTIYDTGSFGARTYTYNALAHGQFTARGTVLFSFNVNSFDHLTEGTASLYRPRFFRVSVADL